MDKINTIKKYIRYRRKSVNKYKIHSPFVYEFYIKILEDKRHYNEYDILQDIRSSYLKDFSPIEVIDFGTGAGDKNYNSYYRKVNEIAKRAGQSRKYLRLLFRLIRYFKPENILEMGTSLGISTAAFSLANPDASIQSVEGCSGTASAAEEMFAEKGLKNVKLHIGDFEKVLPVLLSKTEKLDFVYFDGNHRKEPTLDYFTQCLKKVNNESIFVFDDIYWSKGMEEAWDVIKAHNQVSLSIDLFQMGIVFFRKESTKQDFILKY